MKILILTQWYPPEPALLLQELAQTLIDSGHEVDVLTGFPNYPSGEIYPGYKLTWRTRETLAGVPITRVAIYPEHSESKIKRIANYISFALSSTILGPWLLARPDVIFVYHPPLTVGIPAFFLSKIWSVPFVYQIQDMWPETLSATGMVNSPRILKWIDVFARWVYRRAQTILVISPGFKDNLLDKDVPPEKIHIIPNWVDLTIYHPEAPDLNLAHDLGLAGKFNVLFAGNIGRAQGLETVIEAAYLLKDHPDIQFVFVGDGIALPELKRQVQVKKLDNVRFLGRYPASAMSHLFALSDVLLVHLNDDPLFQITIPHKILSYLAAGKPILGALKGDGAQVILNEAAGITCEPQNPKALSDAVQYLYGLPQSERDVMGQRALEAARRKYSKKILVAEIDAVLRQIASSNSAL